MNTFGTFGPGSPNTRGIFPSNARMPQGISSPYTDPQSQGYNQSAMSNDWQSIANMVSTSSGSPEITVLEQMQNRMAELEAKQAQQQSVIQQQQAALDASKNTVAMVSQEKNTKLQVSRRSTRSETHVLMPA
jgi:hypothetical protein